MIWRCGWSLTTTLTRSYLLTFDSDWQHDRTLMLTLMLAMRADYTAKALLVGCRQRSSTTNPAGEARRDTAAAVHATKVMQPLLNELFCALNDADDNQEIIDVVNVK